MGCGGIAAHLIGDAAVPGSGSGELVVLARAVRRKVTGAVQRMTGLEVIEVNVTLNDIHLPGEEEREASRLVSNRAMARHGNNPGWRAAAVASPPGMNREEVDAMNTTPASVIARLALGLAASQGDAAFLRGTAMTRRNFDQEFREGAVRIVRETGKPIAQVARELGGNEGTLGRWVNLDRRSREGEGALSESERAELNRLRKENAELAMERDVLKRSAALWVKDAMRR